jgi:[glutamine synthetase] adenylyltransferase / [glutamine synthetase]-adenylyl-L-tyrosine phosphorylase
VHLLTMHSASGRLYEVDMRLRPNGKGGFLMTGNRRVRALPARRRLDLGAPGAAARARGGGRSALCERFAAARRRALCVDVHRETLRVDVMEMRARMRRELTRAKQPASSTSSRMPAASPTSNSSCSTGS